MSNSLDRDLQFLAFKVREGSKAQFEDSGFAQHDTKGNDNDTEEAVILTPLLRQKNLLFGFGQQAV